MYIKNCTVFVRRNGYRKFLTLSHVKYFTAIGGLPVSLCVKSVGNQHIFLNGNVKDIYINSKFHDFPMTFCQIFIFHMTFPGLDFIFQGFP